MNPESIKWEPPLAPACAYCAYWTGDPLNHAARPPGERNGECRRYPPTNITTFETGFVVYPHTDSNHWCGEFREWQYWEFWKRESPTTSHTDAAERLHRAASRIDDAITIAEELVDQAGRRKP